jgi:hypothetical protein
LLWEAAGGETRGHQGRKRGEELRLHRIPELHTIQTLNQLQHEDNENYDNDKDSPRSPRQQHIQQQQHQGDPVATVATVMITALRAMVEGQTASAAAAAPPPPPPPPPPRSSIKARVISHHPSRAPPLPVATAPVGRYEQPTYPLQNPARYYTNGGQDTIGGSFNASGIYGPRNFSQQQGQQRLVTSRGASQQLQQGQGSGPWVETRKRWQSEYGVDHEVYPYFESKIPRHSSYSSRSNSHSHTAPRRQRSGGGRGVSTGSGVGVYVPESEDENDVRVTDLVTERSILEDMKQSQFHRKSLQQRHGLGQDWSSSQEEDWDGTEERRRWEQGQHQQRERQSRGQGQSHLSSDGSLEEYSFPHHKPHQQERQPQGLRQGQKQRNKQRQGQHGGGRGQESQEESDVDLYDPQQLGSSLFPLPRPLVSYQMNNAATKETIDWDMDSLLAEDQEQRRRQGGQQRGQQEAGIRRGRSKGKGGAIEREDESVEELLSMKPLRSVTTSRSGEKKRLRHQPQPLHLVPENHRTHSRDRLRERGVWDQQQQEEEEHWYSPTKDLSSSVSSSDQSLTSASASLSGYGTGAVFGSRRGGGYGELLLVPTLSDYEPSTPTLSIATDSTSSDKFQRKREHLRHTQKPQGATEDTKSPASSGPLSSQRSVEGNSSSFSSSSPPPSAYSTSSSSSCSSEAEAVESPHSNSGDEGSSTLGEDKSEFADSSDSDSDFDHLLNLQSEHRDKSKGGDKKDGLLAAKSIIATAAGAKRNEPPVLDRSKVRLWKPDSGVLRKKS